MKKIKDIKGQRFGLLEVLELTEEKGPYGDKIWKCKCDCGNIAFVSNNHIKTRKSCGCLRRNSLENLKTHSHTTHGGEGTRLYGVWHHMKQRCENPHHNSYHNYGGRGITVCEQWRDFAKFREWAIANGYDENAPRGACTIDRIDNDKGYSPDNCRWVDMKTQCSNKRKCK